MSLVRELFSLARDRICLSRPYLALALDRLHPIPDPHAQLPSVDGRHLICPPTWAREALSANDGRETMLLLHTLAHCLLGHILLPEPTELPSRLWNLACDLRASQLAEAILPGALSRDGRFRELRRRFGEAGEPAELARRMVADDYVRANLAELEALLSPDDHSLWVDVRREERQFAAGGGEGLRELWRDAARLLRGGSGLGRGLGTGALCERVKLDGAPRRGFAEYLRRYAVLRENPREDHDAFRYAPYLYGVEQLGAPLLEPMEYREERGIAALAIAIDTSGSCARGLTKRFLELTRDILFEENLFFRRFRLRILQCDAEVRRDDAIASRSEFERYIEDLTIVGGGGTDFRPAFERVNRHVASGELRGLRGMLYFSDARGIFPAVPPEYEATFVLLEHRFDDIDMPPWARKLVIGEPAPVG